MDILLASNNKKKIDELRHILGLGFNVLSLKDIGLNVEVKEDADSFVGNAMKKAVEVAHRSKLLSLADDSGLCVDALGGRPGVFSARYAGHEKDDRKNNEKLLADLMDKPVRSGKFVSVVCIAGPDGALGIFRGEIEGRICEKMQGKNGFGYDPVFIPKGYNITFAQMSWEEKNKISHRKMALEKAKCFLEGFPGKRVG